MGPDNQRNTIVQQCRQLLTTSYGVPTGIELEVPGPKSGPIPRLCPTALSEQECDRAERPFLVLRGVPWRKRAELFTQ